MSLQNYFRISHHNKKTESETDLAKRIQPKRNSDLHERRAATSFQRATNWSRGKLLDTEALKTLKDGTIPLVHETNVEFRERNRPEEIHKNDIYLRTYTPAGDRAEKTYQEFRNGHLEQTPFVENKQSLEKGRVPEKEVGPAMRYGLRTASERLANQLDGPNRLLDSAEKDTTMLYRPSWKDVEKGRWSAPKDFDLTTCYYRGKKSAEPWSVISGGINIGDTYTDGFEIVGDNSRVRRKHKEISSKGFITTVGPSHKSQASFMPPLDSVSIRASKSAKFLQTNQPGTEKTYPKTLEHTIHHNNDGFDDGDIDLKPISQMKVIQIKSGSNLDIMKESALTRGKSEMSPKVDNQLKSSLLKSRKSKNSGMVDKNDLIKNTIKIYFD